MLFIDLDGFKHVNDTLGHRSGDEVLRRVADRLRESVRGNDVAIRYGGDEFLVLLDGVGETDVALSVARRLIAGISEPITLAGNMARVGASIGVALATAGNTDAATLIHEADAAAYAAKSSGRGRAHVYDASMRRAADRRRVLEQDLRDAIGRDELVLHFQPIVGTQSGDVEGYEALVRWERPGTGLLPPDEFLPIAEESGLIDAVDAWVLDRAASQLARWRRLFGAERAVRLGQPLPEACRPAPRRRLRRRRPGALGGRPRTPRRRDRRGGALRPQWLRRPPPPASGSSASGSASTTSAPGSAHCRDSPTCRSTS